MISWDWFHVEPRKKLFILIWICNSFGWTYENLVIQGIELRWSNQERTQAGLSNHYKSFVSCHYIQILTMLHFQLNECYGANVELLIKYLFLLWYIHNSIYTATIGKINSTPCKVTNKHVPLQDGSNESNHRISSYLWNQ